MTTEAQVVIGASYGDEGKGHMVDRLAAEARGEATVIRFNSSAQAGHTVVTPDGRRHVFHHVGAGAFTGATTMLSRYFMLHPMLLGEELRTLADVKLHPRLYADRRAPVAVPYDVLINQIAEEARGPRRHGSCGIGYNEAVERSLRPRFALDLDDLRDRRALRTRLRAIRDHWVPRRLDVLGLEVPEDERGDLLRGDELIRRWLFDAEALLEALDPLNPGQRPPGRPIFEGAQGLLLDQEGDDYPHVTRSRTGLANVIRIAQETDIEELEVSYVSRAYLTRHGAGPLPRPLPKAPDGIRDDTNLANRFQGALRFAWLDADDLGRRLQRDLDVRAAGIRVRAGLAVTCLDQLSEFPFWRNGRLETGNEEEFLAALQDATGLPVTWCGRGAERAALERRAVAASPPFRIPTRPAPAPPKLAVCNGVRR